MMLQRLAVTLNSLSTQSIALIVLAIGCAMFVFATLAHVEQTFAASFCSGIVGLASGILTGHTLSRSTTTETPEGGTTSQTTQPAQANFSPTGVQHERSDDH